MRKLLSVIAAVFVCAGLSAQSLKEKISVENGLVDAVRKMSLGFEASGVCADLVKLAAKDPSNDAVQYYLGLCEISLGNAEAAEAAFLEACRLDPSNDTYQEKLASLYAAVGKDDKAADIYLDLLEKKPGKYRNAISLTMLAERQMFQRKDSLALANYEAALLYDPEYAPAMLGRAEILRMKGNLAAFFAQAHEFAANPDYSPYAKCSYIDEVTSRVDARLYQVWHVQLDSLVTACVNAHPADSSALKLAGRWFYGTGDKERGEAYFNDYLKFYPKSPEPHYIRLSLLNAKDDNEGMVEECKAIIAIAGEDKDMLLTALSTMGDCYHNLGDNASSYACYEKALKIDPDNLLILNNYAYFLCLEGKKLAKAQKMSRRTVDQEPDNATYLDTYGWILHLRGKDKEAKPYFKHAMLYGGKENKEVLAHYSIVLEALGEKELSVYYKGLADSRE